MNVLSALRNFRTDTLRSGRPARRLATALLPLILLLLPARLEAAFTLVQKTSGGGATGNFSAVLGATPTQNNLLIAICATRASATLTGPSGWTMAIRQVGNPTEGIWYKVAGSGESTTVTCSASAGGNTTGIMVFEYSGAATSSPLDGTPGSAAGTSASIPTGTPTGLSFANDLLIGAVVTQAGASLSGQTNSFVEQFDFTKAGGIQTLFGAFSRTHSGNSNTTTVTSTASGARRGQIVAFKSASPTAVDLTAFYAVRDGDRVSVEWHSGFEVRNLGYHVYRDQGGARTRLTRSPVAGSALTVGARTPLTAGQAYRWTDFEEPGASASYVLESIDLDGRRTWYGPIVPVDGQLDDTRALNPGTSALGSTQALSQALSLQKIVPLNVPVSANTPDLATQRGIAAGAAIKVFVNTPGWYRVGQSELVAAGMSPSADPRTLRLFADGVEQPIKVSGEGDGVMNSGDALEFYGTGVNTPWTDRQVYWIVWGGSGGRRIPVEEADATRRRTNGHFPFTVGYRERSVFFGALQNGETENWFGPMISDSEDTQIDVTLSQLDRTAGGKASIEVTLQGVSAVDATRTDHRIGVLVNNIPTGELTFDGQANLTRRLSFGLSLLREGVNTIRFEARGGAMDVSLLDMVKLTYPHRYAPDGDALWCSANGGGILTLNGFADAGIRILDITDPDDITEIVPPAPTAGPQGYSTALVVPGRGERRLLAFTDGAVASPLQIVANETSSWHESTANYVLIAHSTLIDSLDALATLREGQGYAVATIDVDDLYDEFSYGRKTPHAIRDFLNETAAGAGTPRFVTLVGDATSDPRDYAGLGDADLVPTMFVPMNTVSLEAASDDALADSDADGTADAALVGRLPMRTPEQAAASVAKIVAYEAAEPLPSVLLAADANDEEYDFESMSDGLGAIVSNDWVVMTAYAGQLGSSGAHTEIMTRLQDSPWLVNYTGHGSTTGWGESATLFSTSDVPTLTNATPALVVAMNCLNGFFTGVYAPEESLAESLMRAAGGAAAVWASSSLTTATGQLAVNRRFYERLVGGDDATLGEALRAAKTATADTDVRRSWILFGDPALRVRFD
jgi:hypothetical protein